MKRMIRLLLPLLTMLFLFGCTGKDAELPETQPDNDAEVTETSETVLPDYETTVLTLPGANGEISVPVYKVEISFFDGCSLIRAEEAAEDMVWNIAHFRGDLESDYGMKVKISSDWLMPGEEVPAASREILIGPTNRPESPDTKDLGQNDYVIRFENDRLILCGGSDAATEAAMSAFAEYLIDTDAGLLYLPSGNGYVCETAYICDSLTVDGVELFDYTATKGLEELERRLAAVTGHTFTGRADRTLTLAQSEDDVVFSVNAENGDLILSYGKSGTPEKAIIGFMTLLSEKGGYSVEKTHQTAALTSADLACRIMADDLAKRESAFLYVAPDGDDGAAGTEGEPLRTLNGAREVVREMLKSSLSPITVYFRGGDYIFDASVGFDEADSGSSGAPVTYAAYPGETVRFLGGRKIDAGLIARAENSEILNRVNDTAAKNALMQIDLSSLVPVIPDIYSYGHTADNAKMPVEIYFGENALTTAR